VENRPVPIAKAGAVTSIWVIGLTQNICGCYEPQQLRDEIASNEEILTAKKTPSTQKRNRITEEQIYADD
jgi:hypothetical protein